MQALCVWWCLYIQYGSILSLKSSKGGFPARRLYLVKSYDWSSLWWGRQVYVSMWACGTIRITCCYLTFLPQSHCSGSVYGLSVVLHLYLVKNSEGHGEKGAKINYILWIKSTEAIWGQYRFCFESFYSSFIILYFSLFCKHKVLLTLGGAWMPQKHVGNHQDLRPQRGQELNIHGKTKRSTAFEW